MSILVATVVAAIAFAGTCHAQYNEITPLGHEQAELIGSFALDVEIQQEAGSKVGCVKTTTSNARRRLLRFDSAPTLCSSPCPQTSDAVRVCALLRASVTAEHRN